MFDKYAEHLRDSALDNSRFDGFDRGDSDDISGEIVETVIGRMRCYHGTVEVVQISIGMDTDFCVRVNGRMVTDLMDRDRALRVGRWWVNGAAA
jgi:hypothetical protein